MIETTTDETKRRNLFSKKTQAKDDDTIRPTPRDCRDCGRSFKAIAGFVCKKCEKNSTPAEQEWRDPDEYDPNDPGYKVYRIRYLLEDEEKPYDYIGWTGKEKMAARLTDTYAFYKRFPQMSSTEGEIKILYRFPWSKVGREDSQLMEIAQIILSALDPDTVTLNWQHVGRAVRWKALQNLHLQLTAHK